MKTKFLIIILIIAVATSSAITYMIIPVKYITSFYSEWVSNPSATGDPYQ